MLYMWVVFNYMKDVDCGESGIWEGEVKKITRKKQEREGGTEFKGWVKCYQ